VDAVITGHIGRKATKALEEAGIKIYLGAAGKVREAIKAFQAGLYG
jgi:predicted Fe-Mo cluster-binding NifX family protein